MSITKKLGIVALLSSFKIINITHWTNKNIRSRIKKKVYFNTVRKSVHLYMATQIFKLIFVGNNYTF